MSYGNFGKDNLTDATQGSQYSKYISCNKVVSDSIDGPLQKIKIYCGDPNNSGPVSIRVGIYSHDATNNRPYELLSIGCGVLLQGATFAWRTINMSYHCPIEQNTTYWLALQFGDTADYEEPT